MLKIAFSGIPFSGKTTILTEVKKVLSLKFNVESVEEITQKNPFDDNKKSNFISQFFFLSTQINQENIRSLKSPDILLCDRSVLDQWIYWKKHITGLNTTQIEEKNNLIENLYRFWIQTYDHIFFIRIDLKEYKRRENQTEFRTIEPDYISEIETLFLETISQDKLKVTEIWNNATIDECAHKIIKIINDQDKLLDLDKKENSPPNNT